MGRILNGDPMNGSPNFLRVRATPVDSQRPNVRRVFGQTIKGDGRLPGGWSNPRQDCKSHRFADGCGSVDGLVVVGIARATRDRIACSEIGSKRRSLSFRNSSLLEPL